MLAPSIDEYGDLGIPAVYSQIYSRRRLALVIIGLLYWFFGNGVGRRRARHRVQ